METALQIQTTLSSLEDAATTTTSLMAMEEGSVRQKTNDSTDPAVTSVSSVLLYGVALFAIVAAGELCGIVITMAMMGFLMLLLLIRYLYVAPFERWGSCYDFMVLPFLFSRYSPQRTQLWPCISHHFFWSTLPARQSC
jgi:hypothetical protein